MKNLSPYEDRFCKKTGIDSDYWNEFWPIICKFYNHGLEGVAESIKKHPIKTYEERMLHYPHGDIINRKNRLRISRLDQIAGYANTRMTDPKNFTKKDFKKMIIKTYKLIHGELLPQDRLVKLLKY